MRKPARRLKIWALLACALAFTACERDFDEKLKTAKRPLAPKILPLPEDAAEYLNSYRRASGLGALKFNSVLESAAKNHAIYIVKNGSPGHDELKNGRNFTGENIAARAKFAGYFYAGALENVFHKKGAMSAGVAVDGLLSAIYHRFAFLSQNIDEMGSFNASGDKDSAYVFVMGNSRLNEFCEKGESYAGAGGFYSKFCFNENLKMRAQDFTGVFASQKDCVKFPDALPAQPYFSGEVPDPFPECKISANPVSIEFSQILGEIKMRNFEIFKGGERLERVKILTAANDINKRLSPRQFALFAYEPFEPGASYRAVFTFNRVGKDANGEPEKIEWEFFTKTPQNPYFEVSHGDRVAVEADKTYDLFFRPKDCNDAITSVRSSVKKESLTNVKMQNNGANSLSISVSGLKGDEAELKASNGALVKVLLTTSSKSLKARDNGYLAAACALIGAIAIWLLFAVFRRKSCIKS